MKHYKNLQKNTIIIYHYNLHFIFWCDNLWNMNEHKVLDKLHLQTRKKYLVLNILSVGSKASWLANLSIFNIIWNLFLDIMHPKTGWKYIGCLLHCFASRGKTTVPLRQQSPINFFISSTVTFFHSLPLLDLILWDW